MFLVLPSSTVAVLSPPAAHAKVYLDPAMYGDQELRVSAVDTYRERVRRAILQNPNLAPAFYQLSLLDGLSYQTSTGKFGPDGTILKLILSASPTTTAKDNNNNNNNNNNDNYLTWLQEAARVVVDSTQALKRVSAITAADCIALGGAQAIESIGGPVLPVQLGRMDAAMAAAGTSSSSSLLPPIDIYLFSGTVPVTQVQAAFRQAGLTEREMTALLGGLLTIEMVQKTRSTTTLDWKESAKPKFRERGKMGRMSDFKRITDEEINDAAANEYADDDYYDDDDDTSLLGDSDQGWYIADSFGSREERFGDRIGKEDIDEKSFNKYLKALLASSSSSSSSAATTTTGGQKKKTAAAAIAAAASATEEEDDMNTNWIATLLLDPNSPTTQSWLTKYASSNLNYIKDLKIAYNTVTQLGAEYTGGKYESLLKNKPRKALLNE